MRKNHVRQWDNCCEYYQMLGISECSGTLVILTLKVLYVNEEQCLHSIKAFSVPDSAPQWIGSGVCKRWGADTTGQMTWANQRDIPYHVQWRLAIRGRKRFRKVSYLLLGNWLGISPHRGGGKWVPLYRFFFFFFSSFHFSFPYQTCFIFYLKLSCFYASFPSPLSHWKWVREGVSKQLCGAWPSTRVNPQHLMNK